MKVFSPVILWVILFFSPLTHASWLSISETEINRYLQTQLTKKAAYQNKVGIAHFLQLHYHLPQLYIQIKHNDAENVAIFGIIEGELITRKKNYAIQLQLKLDTEPYFDAEKGEIYLHNTRLLEWKINNEKYQQELQWLLPMLVQGVSSLLNQMPVYRLDERNFHESLIKKFGKAIIIEKEKLRLETKIF